MHTTIMVVALLGSAVGLASAAPSLEERAAAIGLHVRSQAKTIAGGPAAELLTKGAAADVQHGQPGDVHGRDGLEFLGCYQRAVDCADAARKKGYRMQLFHLHVQACRSYGELCCAGRK